MSPSSPSRSAAGTVPAPRPAPTPCPPPVPGVRASPAAPLDEGWVAGYEMGRLDAQLAARPVRATVGLTVRARNRDAVEVLAQRYGYELRLREAAEAGFLWAEFLPRS